MKRFVKMPIFLATVAVALAIIIALSGALTTVVVVSAIKNTKEHKEYKTAMAEVNEKAEEYEKHKKENKELKDKLAKTEKELADANALLGLVDNQKLVVAEQILGAQNSPQPVVAPERKVCYLTFDDGPSDRTIEILDILERYEAKATFFVIGSGKLEYLPRIAEKGHTIGLHSNTHRYEVIYSSTDAYYTDLYTLSDTVFQMTGIDSKIVRFPGGGSNIISKNYCEGIMTRLTNQLKIKGYAYFDWNVDSGDASSNRITAEKIVNNVLSQAANKNSICVLMHDLGNKQATVEALPYIIEGLSAMGYSFEGLKTDSFGYQHTVRN